MCNPTTWLILSLSMIVAACGGSMKYYNKADLEVISFQGAPAGQTAILIRPMLESLYYCPGATIRQAAGRLKVSFVRCGIKEKCIVDARAEKADPGQFRVVIAAAPETIDLVFGDGELPLAR